MNRFIFLVWLVTSTPCLPAASAQQVQLYDKDAFKAAVAVFDEVRINDQKIDAALCGRWFDYYLNTLDPSRLYFLDEDIEEFRTYMGRLPEIATSGDSDFRRLVTERYKLRAASALTMAAGQLDGEFDFSIDEEFVLRNKSWPATLDDRRERWRQQLKFELLLEESGGSTLEESRRFLKTRYDSIKQQAAELTDERAFGIYLDSFCKALDVHSQYFTREEFRYFMRSNSPISYTIGLRLEYRNGRAIIGGEQCKLVNAPTARAVMGCELLAIRDASGEVHSFREMFPSTNYELIEFGLPQDESVTLELYDESSLRRFSVTWPRKPYF